LGIKEKINVKLYLPVSEETKKAQEQEESKEGDEQPAAQLGLEYLLEQNEVVLVDDKLSVQEAGLVAQADQLEIELVIKLQFDVFSKGKDYAATLEISPDEPIQQTLQTRLHYFKAFVQQRRMCLFIMPPAKGPGSDQEPTPISNMDSKTFREIGIKEDGAHIQLREPPKNPFK
jgi:hypothetical protein